MLSKFGKLPCIIMFQTRSPAEVRIVVEHYGDRFPTTIATTIQLRDSQSLIPVRTKLNEINTNYGVRREFRCRSLRSLKLDKTQNSQQRHLGNQNQNLKYMYTEATLKSEPNSLHFYGNEATTQLRSLRLTC